MPFRSNVCLKTLNRLRNRLDRFAFGGCTIVLCGINEDFRKEKLNRSLILEYKIQFLILRKDQIVLVYTKHPLKDPKPMRGQQNSCA